MALPTARSSTADVAPGDRAGELAIVVRGGVVESRHVGHACVVAPDGEVVVTVGAGDTPVFPRSALKPWQAATCRRLGARHGGQALDGEALAIATGSHGGTERHLALVRAILADAGLAEDDLGTPPELPIDEPAAHALLAGGGGPMRVAMNCSGKHAAMLTACVANGWATDAYLDFEHPLQLAIRADLEDTLGTSVRATVVDGCGAPQHAVDLDALTRATAVLASRDEHQRAVFAAARAHPWAVASPGSEDTVVMERLDGVLAKRGAEGVQLLATADGWGVVVKVLDGGSRAAMVAALALLAPHVNLPVAEVADEVRPLVRGGGVPVGAVLPGSDLP